MAYRIITNQASQIEADIYEENEEELMKMPVS